MYWKVCLLVVALLVFSSPVSGRAADKTTIAVLDLDISSGVSESYQRVLSDRLRQELFKTGIFTVVERNTMEDVLTEQSLHLAGCTSNECAIEVGRILGVQQMVAGSVGKVGEVHTVSVRLIDVETTEVLAAESVDCSCAIEDVLTTRLREVADLLALSSLEETPEGSLPLRNSNEPEDRWRVNLPEGSWAEKTFLYMEDMNIRAVGTRFGSTVAPGNSSGWFGSMGNGLTVDFGDWRGFYPQILLGGGGMGATKDNITYGVGGGTFGLRMYNFNLDPDDEDGLYSGAGIAFNTMTYTSTVTEVSPELIDPSHHDNSGTYGHLSAELFVGHLFDLHWNLDGRTLYTFVELDYMYLVTSTRQPNGFLSLMTGIGLKLNTF
ncbi:CsgG/HfaB family protein [bacterium]|nr:CsgG/HfaB family protein [bacterium]